jgi:autotransporter-associated beta strand protein
MKTILNVRLILALLAFVAPQVGRSTVFFTDNFSSSTINMTSTPGGTATASYTSYDLASSKNADTSTIGPNLFSLHLASATSSGIMEAQALFTSSAVVLTAPGDYIDLQLVFTNSQGTLFQGNKSPFMIGLYDSGSSPGNPNPPVAGTLGNAGLGVAGNTTGNCASWIGYVGQIFSQAGSIIATRPMQTGTTSQNQDLLGDNLSSSSTYAGGTTLATTTSSPTLTIATNTPYTVDFNITLDPAGSGNLIITNILYSGVGTGGSQIISNSATATGSSLYTAAFDGVAVGAFSHNNSVNPQMDIASITITGRSTPPDSPPTIVTQPTPVQVATGGSCAFYVQADGFDVTYQWHRDGTNITDGGNISGSTSSLLVISPAGSGDVFSGANGYYATVTGSGPYTTNTTTNSLSLISPASLVWSGSDTTWDVDNTAGWLNGDTPAVFNYGDAVTFNDIGSGLPVTLNGPYLSASSVTVDSTQLYTFTGTGSIAGPGNLIYTGSGQLTLDNANTYTGGTLISNSEAYLYLEDYAGLGSGPVTLGEAGGEMEIEAEGASGVGINGDIIVADDFTIIADNSGNYGAVFLGDLSGTANKTLSIVQGSGNTAQTRVRVYGSDTVYNANLDLANDILFAPYQTTGTETYNGVISDAGAVMQKASTITYLNGQNTYSGGTYVPQGSLGLGSSSIGNITSGPIGTGPLYLAPDSTTTTTGTGQVFASSGAVTIANPIEYPTGTNNLTLIVGGSNSLTFSGPYQLNGQDGITTNTFTSRNFEVTNTALTTLAGVISDGGKGYGLNITGPGVLALANTETYTGATTVSNATLQVDGSLAAASSVTVNSNGFLSGMGTIGGAVTVQAGGGLTPGDQGAIGTLTINNTVTLQAGSSNSVTINATANTHDLVVVSSIVYGGTLTVTNLSGTPSVGATYTVFSAGTKSGSFSTVAGSPGPGLGWSFNSSTGVLTVVGSVNTSPTSIGYSVSVSGGVTNLALSWPADHTGWTLQSATNLANPNWTAVGGSTATNAVSVSVTSNPADVFYRLVYIP